MLNKFGIKFVYENGFSFQKNIVEKQPTGGVFYLGEWFSPLYFSSIDEIIQSQYKFSLMDERNNEIAALAADTRSVAVHVWWAAYLGRKDKCVMRPPVFRKSSPMSGEILRMD